MSLLPESLSFHAEASTSLQTVRVGTHLVLLITGLAAP